MRFFKSMMSRKPSPEELKASFDLDAELGPLRRESARADDSGDVNASTLPVEAEAENDRPFEMKDQPASDRLEAPYPPLPEVAASEAEDWDDDWDDEDDDWDDDLEDDLNDPDEEKALQEKAVLVEEIREAMGAVSHISPEDFEPEEVVEPVKKEKSWADDEEFGRKALARNQLGKFAEGAEDRLLQETNQHLFDDEGSARRSAMAHLKAAAAATKADRILKHVVGQDPAIDPEVQSPYRDDLAKVVRPRVSRQPSSYEAGETAWDGTESDDDAAKFAATSEASLRPISVPAHNPRPVSYDPSTHAPVDLSEEDFASDFDLSEREVEVEAETGPETEAIEDVAEEASFEEFADDTDAAADVPLTMEASEETFESEEDFDDLEDDLDGDDFDHELADALSGDDGEPTDEEAILSEADQTPELRSGESRSIWDVLEDASPAENPHEHEPDEAESFVEVPAPATGRAGRSAGRVKTRLLGFNAAADDEPDVFSAAAAPTLAPGVSSKFPVGWIVVTDGPGRGSCFTLLNGVSQIGRGEEQAVRLDFGDTSISRNNHAAVAYDDERGKFFLGHGGKSNLVRLNGRPVLSTEELTTGDEIRLGETGLKFVAFCSENFGWNKSDKGDDSNNVALA